MDETVYTPDYTEDSEIQAIQMIAVHMEQLPKSARARVLRYLMDRFCD